MKRTALPLLLLLGLSTVSCKDFLNTEPTDFFAPANYYKNEADLNAALNGVYDALTAYDEMYGQNYQADMTAGTDETYRNTANTTGVSVYVYNSANANIGNHWKALYRSIEFANVLLANIDRPTDVSVASRNAIRGQALFLRGYYYFMLVNSFGGVPLKLTPTTGVNDTDIPRASAAEVYAQIIKDMTEAEPLLPTSTSWGFGGRVSKTVAEGMLARVNLYRAGSPVRDAAGYADALAWAQKVVASGEHGLNTTTTLQTPAGTTAPTSTTAYSQIFVNYAQDKYDVRESMWECELWGNRGVAPYQEAGRVGNFSGPQCADPVIGVSYGTLKVHGKVFGLYQAADQRRDWNCAPYNYGTATTNAVKVPVTDPFSMDLGKFRREYETLTPKDRNYTSENFPLLRYADVLLMLAEAENEVNGPTPTAYNALNQVRRRGYGKPLSTPDAVADAPASLSKAAFRAYLQDERVRELCGEALRKADLIRWGILVPTLQANAAVINATAPAARKFAAQAGTSVSERDNLLPIPLYDLSLNKALTQNPGW